jgi:hypothetical protein
MIFGRLSGPKGEVVLIGLAATNLKEMAAGKPLSIGPVPGDLALSKLTIIVLTGETEKDIVEKLKEAKMVAPDTSVSDLL